mgnify:CR=1 FL=1
MVLGDYRAAYVSRLSMPLLKEATSGGRRF